MKSFFLRGVSANVFEARIVSPGVPFTVTIGFPEEAAAPITPEEFGAAGNGVTDDTAALQAAFDALSSERSTVVMNGHYRTSARLTIANKSGFALAGTGGIEAFGTMSTVSGTQVLYLSKCTHFELRDFRLNANGVARGRGEFAAHTLELRSCNNYTVSRVAARNAVTDSVYLSCASDEIGDPALHNHTALFEYCDFREGYRNTLSMIQGRAITFNRCTFAVAGGTAPQANVDLESNAGDIDGAIQDIEFNDCTFDGAAGYQLLVASAKTPRNIRVNRPIFRNTKGGAVSWNGTDGEINDAVVEDFDAALATRALFDVGSITAAGDLAINRPMISNIANQTSSKPLLYVHSSSAGNVRMIDPVVNGTAHYLVTANAENSGIDGGTFTGTKGSAVVLADPGAFCRNATFNDFEYNPVIIGDDDTLVEGCTFNNPTLNNSSGVIRVVGGSNATLRDLDFNQIPAEDATAIFVASGANVGLLSDVTIDGFGSDPISVDGSITEKNEVYVNGVLDGPAAPNADPVASPDSGLTTAYETPLEISTATLLANDSDADDDSLTVTAVQNGSNGTVSLSGTTITFTPAAGYAGNATFTYTISDGEGGSDTALVTVEVEADTSDTTAPTITSATDINVNENAQLAHALTADESVTWTITSGADQDQFEIVGSTLRWAGNGTQDFESPADFNTDNGYKVQVTATDAAGNETDQLITVTVTDVADSGGDYSFAGDADIYQRYDASNAASITASGGVVSQLADLSAAGTRHAVQATGSNQPGTGTTTQNGLGVLDFDGSDYMEAALSDYPGDATIFLVARVDVASANFSGLWAYDGSSDYQIDAGNAPDFRYRANTTSGSATYGSTDLKGTYRIFALRHEVGGTIKLFVDGTQSAGAETNYPGSFSSTMDFRLFSNRGAGGQVEGKFAEMIVVGRAMSASDMNAWFAEIKAKWDTPALGTVTI